MVRGTRDLRRAASPPAARPVVEEGEAIRLLDAACQPQDSYGDPAVTNALAPLVESASFLAAHCSETLLKRVLEACDATTLVGKAPKRLTMLNAAWKLLRTIASYEKVNPAHYEVAVAHMIAQLQWGVLAHDWSDKRRVRLATFFASHLTSTVRAHPRLLLRNSPDSVAAIDQLVRLYYAVCVTVATSKGSTEAVTLLYDNVAVRLEAVFDCLGGAAALTAAVSIGTEVEVAAAGAASVEDEEGAVSSSTELGTLRDLYSSPTTAMEDLLVQCVSSAAAQEVVEAADSGAAVRMAVATASLNLYLCVVRGALGQGSAPVSAGSSLTSSTYLAEKKDSVDCSVSGGGEEAAAGHAIPTASPPRRPSALPLRALAFLMQSLLWWIKGTDPPAKVERPLRDGEVGAEEKAKDASHTGASHLQQEVLALAALLPPRVFNYRECTNQVSSTLAAESLRTAWTDAVATVLQQWFFLVALADDVEAPAGIDSPGLELGQCSLGVRHTMAETPAGLRTTAERGGDGAAEEEGAVAGTSRRTSHASAVLASLLVSSVTGMPHYSATTSMLLLEAWVAALQLVEVALRKLQSVSREAECVVTAVLQVLLHLRRHAVLLVGGCLSLRWWQPLLRPAKESLEMLLERHAGYDVAVVRAVPLQGVCAVIALLSYGEASVGVDTAPFVSPPPTCSGEQMEEHAEEVQEMGSANAHTVVMYLTIVMRAHLRCGAAFQLSGGPHAMENDVAALRALCKDIQDASSTAARKGDEAARAKTLRRWVTLKLLEVPVQWQALIAHTETPTPTSQLGIDLSLPYPTELKMAVCSLASVLAAFTHTLQDFYFEPGLSKEERNKVGMEEEEKGGCGGGGGRASFSASTRIARWVAARLLEEVAVVPLSENNDDAVLVACVRRWIDLAVPRPPSLPSTGGGEGSNGGPAQDADDAVALANAAVALLHFMEECATLPVEKLRLSEHAAHCLMSLLQGSEAGNAGTGDGHGDSGSPSWPALRSQEAVLQRDTASWLSACRRSAAERRRAEASAGCRLAVPWQAVLPPQTALPASSSSTVDILRRLSYCETVLRQLGSHELAVLEEPASQRKRHRDEDVPQSPDLPLQGERRCSSPVLHNVQRIYELSRALLAEWTSVTTVKEPQNDVDPTPLVSASSAGVHPPSSDQRAQAVAPTSATCITAEADYLPHVSATAEVIDIE